MGIQDIIEGKKQWRAHMARVKALPPDYQIAYKDGSSDAGSKVPEKSLTPGKPPRSR